jgi:YD repeat-containing protein
MSRLDGQSGGAGACGGRLRSGAPSHGCYGRIATSTQTVGTGSAYLFSYQYSLADQLTQTTYPSGRKVDYVPDAAGRIQNVTNDASGLVYATVGYTPASDIRTVQMPSITEALAWNDRGQVTQLAAGVPNTTPLLTLGLYPCPGTSVVTCPTGNTGSLQSQSIVTPGLTLTQSYGYDTVNRRRAARNNGNSSNVFFFKMPGWRNRQTQRT